MTSNILPRPRLPKVICCRIIVLVAGLLGCIAVRGSAQPSLPITFKYVPRPADNFVRIYVPGEFNGWNISVGSPAIMSFDTTRSLWTKTVDLVIGQTYQYKFNQHLNQSGTSVLWLSDPANPRINPAEFNNSLITIEDPMVFEMDRRTDASNRVTGVSAGVFSSSPIVELSYEINGDTQPGGLELFDPESGIFSGELENPVQAGAQFKLSAVTENGDTLTAIIGTLPVEVVDLPRPPGTADGVSFADAGPTVVTFSLFAPGKQFVHLIGDFNDWELSDEYVMNRDSVNADSVYFWLTVDGLSHGVEYAFQYLVDGSIAVADPYSEKLLDPAHDTELGSVYPGLKPYPSGKTQHIVSVFRTAPENFEWEVLEYDRPPQSELVIYELLIRDFISRHDYSTLIDTLDYLERLGVNAIELMPVSEFGGNLNWGYEPNFAMAPDKYYGPSVDLKRFIDACHRRGMAVILDVVYNHQAGEAPFSRLYNTSLTGDPGGAPTSDSPWLNTVARHPFNVFNDVNHESKATQYWLDRTNAFWLDEYRVDGFRFDLSKGFTQVNSGNNVELWGRYDATRIRLLKRMADRIWETDSTAYIILEHFAEDREEEELAAYGMDRGYPGMLFWNNLNHAYNEATMGYHSGGGSNFSRSYYGPGGRNWDLPHVISYMESHDEQWLMLKNLRFGACEASPGGGGRCDHSDAGYNVRDLPVALDRQKMAGAFFFTLPGPRMMWQFGELGYGHGPNGRDCLRPSNESFGDCPAGTPTRTGVKPIRWEYYADPLRRKLYSTWAALLKLRADHEAFRSTETAVSLNLGGAIKSIALVHPSMSVAIIGNFGVTSSAGSSPFDAPGIWYDFFSDDSLLITNPDTVLTLAAGEFHLFTNRRLDPPEPGLITVSSEPLATPTAYRLDVESFPNPFQNTIGIRYTVEEAGSTTLMLFDSLGRQLKRVDHANKSQGAHVETLDLSGVASGTYFVRVTTPGGFRTVPVTKTGR
ncbi:MAG TPA: alpha-amylase family glycosyl hydrolase [Rhodothermales bacterium]|nr:alpha-amylase family glycosyl hydrolase [Rhodothermales bacterium]